MPVQSYLFENTIFLVLFCFLEKAKRSQKKHGVCSSVCKGICAELGFRSLSKCVSLLIFLKSCSLLGFLCRALERTWLLAFLLTAYGLPRCSHQGGLGTKGNREREDHSLPAKDAIAFVLVMQPGLSALPESPVDLLIIWVLECEAGCWACPRVVDEWSGSILELHRDFGAANLCPLVNGLPPTVGVLTVAFVSCQPDTVHRFISTRLVRNSFWNYLDTGKSCLVPKELNSKEAVSREASGEGPRWPCWRLWL